MNIELLCLTCWLLGAYCFSLFLKWFCLKQLQYFISQTNLQVNLGMTLKEYIIFMSKMISGKDVRVIEIDNCIKACYNNFKYGSRSTISIVDITKKIISRSVYVASLHEIFHSRQSQPGYLHKLYFINAHLLNWWPILIYSLGFILTCLVIIGFNWWYLLLGTLVVITAHTPRLVLEIDSSFSVLKKLVDEGDLYQGDILLLLSALGTYFFAMWVDVFKLLAMALFLGWVITKLYPLLVLFLGQINIILQG